MAMTPEEMDRLDPFLAQRLRELAARGTVSHLGGVPTGKPWEQTGAGQYTGITGGKPISPTGPLGSEGSTSGGVYPDPADDPRFKTPPYFQIPEPFVKPTPLEGVFSDKSSRSPQDPFFLPRQGSLSGPMGLPGLGMLGGLHERPCLYRDASGRCIR